MAFFSATGWLSLCSLSLSVSNGYGTFRALSLHTCMVSTYRTVACFPTPPAVLCCLRHGMPPCPIGRHIQSFFRQIATVPPRECAAPRHVRSAARYHPAAAAASRECKVTVPGCGGWGGRLGAGSWAREGEGAGRTRLTHREASKQAGRQFTTLASPPHPRQNSTRKARSNFSTAWLGWSLLVDLGFGLAPGLPKSCRWLGLRSSRWAAHRPAACRALAWPPVRSLLPPGGLASCLPACRRRRTPCSQPSQGDCSSCRDNCGRRPAIAA